MYLVLKWSLLPEIKSYNNFIAFCNPLHASNSIFLADYKNSLPANVTNPVLDAFNNRYNQTVLRYQALKDAEGKPLADIPKLITDLQGELGYVAVSMLGYIEKEVGTIQGDWIFKVRLIDRIEKFGPFLGEFLKPLWTVKDSYVFHDIMNTFNYNRGKVSELMLKKNDLMSGMVVNPDSHTGAPTEIALAYLKSTPFQELFNMEIPFGWKDQTTRFEHTWIVAPPKTGKTTVLKALVGYDLSAVINKRASIIVMDSQGQILNTIKKLAIFDQIPLYDLDPAQELSINPFWVKDRKTEHANNAVVDLIEYTISALAESPVTPKQRGMLRRVIRAMMQTPDATMKTLMDVLKGTVRISAAELDPSDRDYIEQTFYRDATLAKTKEEVAWRIDGIISHSKTMERMLSQPHSDIDFGNALSRPSVTLINTNDNLMGKDGSTFFGRFCIAQIAKAARNRKGDGTDMPVYVYVDEAHDIIKNDDKIAELLMQVRKYNVAFTFAHQAISQLKSTEVVDALALSGTLFAGRNRDDAARFANYMNCKPELITNCKVGEFVAFIRDQEPNRGVRIKVPNNVLESLPLRVEVDSSTVIPPSPVTDYVKPTLIVPPIMQEEPEAPPSTTAPRSAAASAPAPKKPSVPKKKAEDDEPDLTPSTKL